MTALTKNHTCRGPMRPTRHSRGRSRPVPRRPGSTGSVIKRIILASPRGYCAGVRRAVETVEEALNLWGPPIYVRKQIVHNVHVVRDLEQRGAIFVDSEEDVPRGARVVFSAHGVSPAVNAGARARGLQTIDATCPLVTKVHPGGVGSPGKGYTIILIGHAGHDEVDRHDGRGPRRDFLVESVADADGSHHRRRATRLPDADDAVRRRDRRDHRSACADGSRTSRRRRRRHLLRDDEPPACRQGNSARDRPSARDRITQQLELESAGRSRTIARRGRPPDRRRDRHPDLLVRRCRNARPDLGRLRARITRTPSPLMVP